MLFTVNSLASSIQLVGRLNRFSLLANCSVRTLHKRHISVFAPLLYGGLDQLHQLPHVNPRIYSIQCLMTLCAAASIHDFNGLTLSMIKGETDRLAIVPTQIPLPGHKHTLVESSSRAQSELSQPKGYRHTAPGDRCLSRALTLFCLLRAQVPYTPENPEDSNRARCL